MTESLTNIDLLTENQFNTLFSEYIEPISAEDDAIEHELEIEGCYT